MAKLSKKAQALLCYLVVLQHPASREMLTNLFWSETSEKNARTNLRMVLSQLRKALPEHLLITPSTIAFNTASSYRCDVLIFVAHLQETDEGVAFSHTVLDLYRGDFLEGMFLKDAPLFENWVLEQREWYRTLAARIFANAIQYCSVREDYESGIALTTRLLQLDPFNESVHRDLMLMWVYSGQRAKAVAHYQSYRQHLISTLNVEPEKATKVLFQQIKDIPQRLPHNLPAFAHSFVGRRAELDELSAQLGHSDCRLLTLTGLGGIGKTRLAIALAHLKLNRFFDGVYYVTLLRHHTMASVFEQLVDLLGCTQDSQQDMVDKLAQCLSGKTILLVLDGFEHLVDEAALLAKLIQRTHLKLLVTSRYPLRLRWEWTYSVSGLAVPEKKDVDSNAFDSVKLFMNVAERVTEFHDADENREIIARICRSLSGMPLALELAALKLHEQSPQALEQNLKTSIDDLKTQFQDMPPHHRSLQAALNLSWNDLTSSQQRLLARLSVFDGAFDLETVQAVCQDDGLEDISNLLDTLLTHSFIMCQEHTPPRYRLLDPIAKYVASKLEEGCLENLKNAHLRHFFALAETSELNKSKDQQGWTQRISTDFDNLHQAFHWALESSQVELAYRVLLGCDWFLANKNLSQRQRWHNQLLAPQEQHDMDPYLRGRFFLLIAHQGLLDHDYAKAIHWADRSVAMFDKTSYTIISCSSIRIKASAYLNQGGFSKAQHWLEQVEKRLQKWHRDDDILPSIPAYVLDEEKLVAHCKRWMPYFLADLAYSLGNNKQALVYLQQQESQCKQDHDEENLALCQIAKALVYFELNNLNHAQALADKVFAHYEKLDFLWGIAQAHHLFGLIQYKKEAFSQAFREYGKVLKIYEAAAFRPSELAEVLGSVALTLLEINNIETSAQLLSTAEGVFKHINFHLPIEQRNRLDQLRCDLNAKFGDTRFNALWHQGQSMSQDEALELALAACDTHR